LDLGLRFLFGCLGFCIKEDEYDLDRIWAEPLDVVVDALRNNCCYNEMVENFPDIVDGLI